MKRSRLLLLFILITCSLFALFACSEEPFNQNEVLTITLSNKNIDFIAPGETYALTATVIPDNAQDRELTWISSNEDVATVDSNGLITAVGRGVCVIRATAKNGITATAIATVGSSRPSLSLSESMVLFSSLGQTATVTATTEDGEITDSDILWLTSNAEIASCEGGVITANGYGICTVTARAKSGAISECLVVVEEPDNAYCYISQESARFSAIDERLALTATVSSNPQMKISWISSNPEIATVENGTVISKGFGTCAIIALADNGLSAACIVTVGEEETVDNPFSDKLKFDVRIPATSKYVNKATGQIESVGMVIASKTTVVDNTSVAELGPGELGVIVELKCVKIFDCDGTLGEKSIAITAATYKMEDGEEIFCTNQSLREPECKIGTEFVRKVFVRIMTDPNEQRHFFIMIDEYTIL